MDSIVEEGKGGLGVKHNIGMRKMWMRRLWRCFLPMETCWLLQKFLKGNSFFLNGSANLAHQIHHEVQKISALNVKQSANRY